MNHYRLSVFGRFLNVPQSNSRFEYTNRLREFVPAIYIINDQIFGLQIKLIYKHIQHIQNWTIIYFVLSFQSSFQYNDIPLACNILLSAMHSDYCFYFVFFSTFRILVCFPTNTYICVITMQFLIILLHCLKYAHARSKWRLSGDAKRETYRHIDNLTLW